MLLSHTANEAMLNRPLGWGGESGPSPLSGLQLSGSSTPGEMLAWWDGVADSWELWRDNKGMWEGPLDSGGPTSATAGSPLAIDTSPLGYETYQLRITNVVGAVTGNISMAARGTTGSIYPDGNGGYSCAAVLPYTSMRWYWSSNSTIISNANTVSGESARAFDDSLVFELIHEASGFITSVSGTSLQVPAQGTSAGTTCSGFDLYNTQHTGHGTTVLSDLVESNSSTCGYVPFVDNDGDGVPAESDPDDNDPNNPQP